MRIHVCALLLLLFTFGCTSNDTKKNPEPTEKTTDLPVFTIGQWADYKIIRFPKESDINTNKNTLEATIKISLVGEKVIQSIRYYWVEYLINKGKEQQRIVKILIDKKGAVQPIRVITKNGKFTPVEIDLRRWETRTRLTKEMLLQELTGGFNIIPIIAPKHQEKSETEELSLKLEEKDSLLKCRKVNMENNQAGTIWYNEKIPFAGLVKAEFSDNNCKNTILLTAYGVSGAKTLIKEEPKELDFQE
jgi:hypothetical protein